MDRSKSKLKKFDDGSDQSTSNIQDEMDTTQAADKRPTPTLTNPPVTIGRFLSIHLIGSIESGYFKSFDDIYIKYSLVAGPDWIISSGTDVGVTQISRYNRSSSQTQNGWRKFVWNQPVSISYRSYNYYGWPQIVLSVYYFDTFGNDQILGYGSTHLPITNQWPTDFKQEVEIYTPQSSSISKQLLSWLTGKKPELVDSNLFARPDCRRVLQVVRAGQVNLKFNLTTKDVTSNGYRSWVGYKSRFIHGRLCFNLRGEIEFVPVGTRWVFISRKATFQRL